MIDETLIALGDFPVTAAKNIAEKLESLDIPFQMEQYHSIEKNSSKGSFGANILITVYVHQSDIELVLPIVQSITKIVV